ncbi:LPD5 domain-containing protein [Barnesiella propionica]|uniref:MuF-C-terminal domain-containing protein n=1 Tax=Barnesiella propionica TaxID=2981781 RepID=UPI0011C8EB34|nr:LPD38 domain-containing protein [Barnesiella propionica]MCU6767842.1 LPD5 domain-containing protein [Barnesiella propionica]
MANNRKYQFTVNGKTHEVSQANIDKYGWDSYANAYPDATVRMRDNDKADYDVPINRVRPMMDNGLHPFTIEYSKARKPLPSKKQDLSEVQDIYTQPINTQLTNVIPPGSSENMPSFYKMPILEKDISIDEKGNRVTSPKLIPNFDPENGGVTAPPVYRDVLTGKTYDPEDVNVQEAKQFATTSRQLTNVPAQNREQVANLSKEIDAELNRRGKELDVESRKASWGDLPRGSGGAVHTFNASTNNGRLADEEYRNLQAARNSMTDAQRIIDEADHNAQRGTLGKWLESSFAGGATRGFGQKLFDVRTWDLGMSDLSDNVTLLQALDDFDKGRELSRSQQMLLDAKAVEMATQAYFGSYVGRGYQAGSVTAESIPFMVEMCINPLSTTGTAATSKLARYAIKRYGKQAINRNAKKYASAKIATRIAGDIAGSAGMTATTGSIRTAADALDRMGGQVQFDTNEEGKSVFAGHTDGDNVITAFSKAFAATTIENHSEMIGDYFAPVLGMVGKYTRKGLGKLGLESVNKFIDDVAMSDAGRLIGDFEKHAKWNGLFSEYAEEVTGNIENALIVGDQTLDTDPDTGVFNVSKNIDTFLGVSLMGGFLSSAKTIGYRPPKYREKRDITAMDNHAATVFGNQDTWGDIRNTLAFGNDADVQKKLCEVVNNPNYTPEQKQSAMDYAKSVQNYKGILQGENKRRTDAEMNRVQIDAEISFDNGYLLETPQEMTDSKINLDFLRQEASKEFGWNEESVDRYLSGDNSIYNVLGLKESGYSDKQVQKAIDYLNARATYDGMIQHVQDDIESRISASHALIKGNTHLQDGQIHAATMKINERKVYVVNGNIVLNGDGTIDNEHSDESIIIRDAETQNIEFSDPSSILSVDESIDPSQEMRAIEAQIREIYSQEAADKIDGVVPFNPGDIYLLTDEHGGQKSAQIFSADEQNAWVLIDEAKEAVVIPKAELQQMVDYTNLARLKKYHEQKALEEMAIDEQEKEANRPQYAIKDLIMLRDENGNGIRGNITADSDADGRYEVYTEDAVNGKRVNLFTRDELDSMLMEHNGQTIEQPVPEITESLPASGENVQNPTENAVEMPESVPTEQSQVSVLERIPKDEQGNPIYEQAETPDLAWDAIVEQTEGDEVMAKTVADGMVADMETALKKIEKSKAKGGTTIAEKIAAEKERKAAIDNAKSTLAIWQKIAGTVQRRKSAAEAERRRIIEEQATLRKAEEEKLRAEREEAERIEREALNGVPDVSDDTPQDARARGYRRVAGHKIDRQQPIQHLQGKEVEVKFSDKAITNGRVAVIDAGELQPSHIQGMRNPAHFIDEAQPKERNDEVSVLSARKIAGNIRPEEITTSVTAYTGAPTVNTRGEVIQGNNRSDALRLMWENEKEQAAIYKQYIKDHADEFGLNAEEVEAMERPVLVNMLDVEDADALTLGQFVAQDTESGGVERIKPKNAVQKMGADMRTFASLLLKSADDETSFAGLVDNNGAEVLKWMSQRGFITSTQLKSAFDSKGGLTAEAKNDLKGIMYQSTFTGGNIRLEEMFNAMPAKAQRAILSTAFRDYDSPNSERMVEEIQNSIRAYKALSQDEAFMNAKNWKEARMAVEDWKRQYAMDDVTGKSYLPAEKFSNFALHLATMYKGESQSFIQGTFNHLFDLIQGTQEENLFEKPDNTPRTLAQAIKETLNIDYNGQQRSNVLAGDSAASQQREQGSTGNLAAGERDEGGSRRADDTGRTESDSEQGRERSDLSSEGRTRVQEVSEEVDNRIGRSLSEQEATDLIAQMEANAEVASTIELTPENWIAQFGEDGTVETPVGVVKMGENQYFKIAQQGRNGKFGMIKPTLQNPDVVIEDYRPAEAGNSERDTSLLFVKTFIKEDGSRYYHFTSVTVKKEGREVVISNQERSSKRISKLLQQGKITWIKDDSLYPTAQVEKSVSLNDSNNLTKSDNGVALLGVNSSANNDLSLSSERRLTETPIASEGPDLIPTSDNISSDGKGNTLSADNQTESKESSELYTITPTTYTNKAGKTTNVHQVKFNTAPTYEQRKALATFAREKTDGRKTRGWCSDKETYSEWLFRSEKDAHKAGKMIADQSDEAAADAQPMTAEADKPKTHTNHVSKTNSEISDSDNPVRELFSGLIAQSKYNVEIDEDNFDDNESEALVRIILNGERSDLWLYNSEGRTADEHSKGVRYFADGLTYEDAEKLADEYNEYYGRVVAWDGKDELGVNFSNVDDAIRFTEWLNRRKGTQMLIMSKQIEQVAMPVQKEGEDLFEFAGRVAKENEKKDKEVPQTTQKQREKRSGQKIKDYGEVIAGARKDAMKEIAKGIGNITVETLITQPLGKVWKKPNLRKMVDDKAITEEEAVFLEAVAQRVVSMKKPTVLKSGTYRRARRGEEIKVWAENTAEKLNLFKEFVEGDETVRNGLIESADTLSFPMAEEEQRAVEKMKELNKDMFPKEHFTSWGKCLTPHPLYVTMQILMKMGYKAGDKVDYPLYTIGHDSAATHYTAYDNTGAAVHRLPSFTNVDEMIECIVAVNKLHRGDRDAYIPVEMISPMVLTRKSIGTGQYHVTYGRGTTIKNRTFKSKAEAEAFISEQQNKGVSTVVHEIEEMRPDRWTVVFFDIDGEKYFASESRYDKENGKRVIVGESFESNEEARRSIEEHSDEWSERLMEVYTEKNAKNDDGNEEKRSPYTLYHYPLKGYAYSISPAKSMTGGWLQVSPFFGSVREAKEWMKGNRETVDAQILRKKDTTMRLNKVYLKDETRKGADYRGGSDVTPEEFGKTFFFRGVQFGNWTNDADRQAALNSAYDALMDLAEVTGISPKAISLNGELGIAFGARGTGNANAHYERDNVVINLTKTRGAGSLAHEWWHALDSYFARMGGMPLGMMTNMEQRRMVMRNGVVREEMGNAYAGVIDAIEESDFGKRQLSNGKYWRDPVEMSARLFDAWVGMKLAEEGKRNNFLCDAYNPMLAEEWKKSCYTLAQGFAEIRGEKFAETFEEFKKRPEALGNYRDAAPEEVQQLGVYLQGFFDTVQECEGKDGNRMLYRDGGLSLINAQFNEELQQQIDGTLPKGHIYRLGNPGNVLLGTGVPNLPIQLNSTRLTDKATKFGHNYGLEEIKDLVVALQSPIAVFAYGDKSKGQNIIVELSSNDKNFVVGLSLNPTIGGKTLEINSIRNVFPKDNAEWLNWITQEKLLYVDKERIQNLINQQRTILADVDYLDLDSVTKIVENFENPSIEDENLRFAKTHDRPISPRMLRKQMAERVKELAEMLHLDNIEALTNVSGLKGRTQKARGFYTKNTGKITIVIPNHTSLADVEQTLLHEAVAHYGLRKMFGTHFDNFLDNVFNHADETVRRRMVDMAVKNGWDFRKATEEYLAGLAERTNFEEAKKSGWWQRIKQLFSEMLDKLGFSDFRGITLTDNELRYILWRSYENLKEGKDSSLFGEATDVAMQYELKVGNYTPISTRDVALVAEPEETYANERFNKQLEGLTDETADSIILDLGMPSDILLSAGLPSKIMRLFGNKLMKKAKKHKFDVKQVRNLPIAVNNPIAVLKGSRVKSFAILTEIEINGNKTLVTIEADKEGAVDFNLVTSVYGKYGNSVVRWINEGKLLTVDKKKALAYLGTLAPIASAQERQELESLKLISSASQPVQQETDTQDLSSAIKIVENFENPTIGDENNLNDSDLLFRSEGNNPGSEAQNLYEKATTLSFVHRFDEAWHDHLRSVKALQESFEQSTGRKTADFENVYLHAMHKSSVDMREINEMQENYVEPLSDALTDIIKGDYEIEGKGIEQEDAECYLNCKHGLERNKKFALRDAKRIKDVKIYELDRMLSKGEIDPVKYDAAKQNAEQKELDDYKRNRERDYSGLTAIFDPEETEMSNAELETRAQEYVYKFEQTVPKDKTDALWNAIGKLTNFSLQKSYLCGNISKQQYNEIRSMFEYYVPLRGFKEETADDVYEYVTREINPFQKADKKASGRTSQADNLFATIMSMGHSAIVQGNKNLVKQKLLNLALNADDPLLSVTHTWYDATTDELCKPNITNNMTAKEQREEVERFDREMKEKEKSGEVIKRSRGLEINRRSEKWQANEHCVRVMRNGMEYQVWVNGSPRAAQAINGILNPDAAKLNMLNSFINKVNRFRAKNVTSLSPEFLISNLQRDIISSNVVGFAKYGLKYFRKFNQNLKDNLSLVDVRGDRAVQHNSIYALYRRYKDGALDMNNKRDRYFAEFIKNGGETGYSQLWTIDDYEKKIKKALRKYSIRGNAESAMSAVGTALEFANRGIENSCRFAAYVTSREMGRSVLESITDAKETSVNFNRKGSGAMGNQIAKSWFMFLNPAIQGLMQYIDLTRKYPKHMLPILGGVIGIGVLMPIVTRLIISAMGGDDEDYYNLSAWTRRNNFVFPIGNNKFGKIALPPEIRAMYGLGEIAYGSLTGHDKYENTFAAIISQLSQLMPLDIVDANGIVQNNESIWKGFAKGITPSMAQPIFESYLWNKDFMGRPITGHTPYDDNLDPEYRKVSRGTLQWLVDASRWMNNATGGTDYSKGWIDRSFGYAFNPSAIEHIFVSYLGGIATFAEKSWKMGGALLGNEEYQDIRNYPFISKMVSSTDNDYAQSSQIDAAYKYYGNEYSITKKQVKGYENEMDNDVWRNAERYDRLLNTHEFKRYSIFEAYKPDINYLIKKLRTTEDPHKKKELAEVLRNLKKELVEKLEATESNK